MRGNGIRGGRARRVAASGLLLSLPWLPGPASTGAWAAGEPSLRRVMLSTAGVGFFDFAAEPADDGTIRLTVPLAQVDDVLKSLTVHDARGVVQGVTLPGATPEADLFRDAPVGEGDLASLPALLQALRGAEVAVAGPTRLRGMILNVTREETAAADGRGGALAVRHRVGLLTAEGLRFFVLEEMEGVDLADRELQLRLERLLEGLAATRREQRRELVLSVRGSAPSAAGPVGLGYMAETPVWKATYRLVAGPEEALLQGWAVLENTSGHDWRDVELTLIAGSPRALRQALYRTYFVDRPEAPVAVAERLEDEAAKRGEGAAASSPLARSAPRSLAEGALAADAMPAPAPGREAATVPEPPALAAAAGEELTAQTLYRLPEPARVGAGQSLMAPLVDRRLPVERVALLTSEQQGSRPRAALRLTNPGDAASLPPGLATVYERLGDGSLSFAGDASVPAMPPGAERTLAYAADGKLEARSTQARPRRAAGARVVDGVLELTVAEQRVTTFELRLEDDTPRRLVVDWERPDGWRVVEPADATTGVPGRVRFERTIPGRASPTERLVLEREILRRFTLADVDVGEIVAAAGGAADSLPGPLAAALTRLRELAAAVADAEAEVERLEGERGRLATDQERLRANLESVPDGGDLARRYLDALAASEAAIDGLDQALGRARAGRDGAVAARRDFVRGLRI